MGGRTQVQPWTICSFATDHRVPVECPGATLTLHTRQEILPNSYTKQLETILPYLRWFSRAFATAGLPRAPAWFSNRPAEAMLLGSGDGNMMLLSRAFVSSHILSSSLCVFISRFPSLARRLVLSQNTHTHARALCKRLPSMFSKKEQVCHHHNRHLTRRMNAPCRS